MRTQVSVTSYTVRDHLDPKFKATTIHVAIYKQPLTGEEQLFRHFIRQPDGTPTARPHAARVSGLVWSDLVRRRRPSRWVALR